MSDNDRNRFDQWLNEVVQHPHTKRDIRRWELLAEDIQPEQFQDQPLLWWLEEAFNAGVDLNTNTK